MTNLIIGPGEYSWGGSSKRMARMKPKYRHAVRIRDVVRTTDRALLVILSRNGRALWVPRRAVDVCPGLLMVPEWLFRRIGDDDAPIDL